MLKLNHTERLVQQLKHPKIPYTIFGCYNGSQLIYEGSAALCGHYRETFNPKLKIKGIK